MYMYICIISTRIFFGNNYYFSCLRQVFIQSVTRMPTGQVFENNGCRVCGVAVRRFVVVSGFMRLWLDSCLKEILKQIDQTHTTIDQTWHH